MREIKFRAWHSDFGEMVFSSGEYEYGKREFTPFLFEVGFSHYPQSEWNIMQFTGLKDKNGKDVYEGDILDYGGMRYKEVIFDKGEFCLRGLERMSWLISTCELIGNIYETPELLTPSPIAGKE